MNNKFILSALMALGTLISSPTWANCTEPSHGANGFRYGGPEAPHIAILMMRGCNGTLSTFYFNVQTGRQEAVEQTVTLSNANGGLFFQGKSPVFQGTRRPHPNYKPDSYFAKNTNGEWQIQVCDTIRNCAQVEYFDVTSMSEAEINQMANTPSSKGGFYTGCSGLNASCMSNNTVVASTNSLMHRAAPSQSSNRSNVDYGSGDYAESVISPLEQQAMAMFSKQNPYSLDYSAIDDDCVLKGGCDEQLSKHYQWLYVQCTENNVARACKKLQAGAYTEAPNMRYSNGEHMYVPHSPGYEPYREM